jgi:hypothetical protein
MTRFGFDAFLGITLCAWTIGLGACTSSEQRTYENAIEAAAVRGPGWDAPLWPVPAGSVSVSTFTEDAVLDIRTLYVWVGATQEIWQKCKQRRDPVLRLQELLGLPPQPQPKPGNQWHFFVFDIDSRDLIRPCPGGEDNALAALPKCRLGSDLDPQLDAELTKFLLQQWWLAHRATVERGRDPELGYPWTGMGWTYDWSPASKSHRGVSEFIVRKSAVIEHVRTMSPADFCRAAAPPVLRAPGALN